MQYCIGCVERVLYFTIAILVWSTALLHWVEVWSGSIGLEYLSIGLLYWGLVCSIGVLHWREVWSGTIGLEYLSI